MAYENFYKPLGLDDEYAADLRACGDLFSAVVKCEKGAPRYTDEWVMFRLAWRQSGGSERAAVESLYNSKNSDVRAQAKAWLQNYNPR